MPKHPDFQKIFSQFVKRYGKERGERFYYAWLNKMKLDDTKPYGSQKTESFQWAKPVIAQYKETEDGFTYWKVEAAFPTSSMNRNVYTEAELKASARTIIGKPLNLNHDVILESDLAKILDAEYEDGAVEVLIGVAKDGFGKEINDRILSGTTESPKDNSIVHVSLEADCKRGMEEVPEGKKCCGLIFTGLALLDKAVLPGIPLTRLYAAESFTGEFEAMVAEGIPPITLNREDAESKTEASMVTEPEATKPLQPEPASAKTPNPQVADKEPQAQPSPPPVATAGSGSPPNPVATATTSADPRAVTTVNPSGGTTTYTISYPEPPKIEPQAVPKQDTVPTKAEPTPPKGDEAPPKTDTPVGASPQGQGTGPGTPSPPTPAEDPNKLPETTDAILTEPGFWDRFNIYHQRLGFSRQDSFRLTSMDILKHIQKGKK